MAFLKKGEPEIPPIPPIPRIHDHPEIRSVDALLAQLNEGYERIKCEREILVTENVLRSLPQNSKSSAGRDIRDRLATLKKRLPPRPVAQTTLDGLSPAVAGAIAAIKGDVLPPKPELAEAIEELDQRAEIVAAACNEQMAAREDIEGRLTLEYSRQMKPAWDELQLIWYRSAQDLARITGRVRDFRAAISAAGIQSRSDIIAMPNVRSPLMLGDESVWNSELSEWRRILERLGVLK